VYAGQGQLADRLSAADGDPEVVPVRVAWLPRERDGDRRARLRDLLALRNPRRPKPAAQARIERDEPERYRVVVGEPATVSALRGRFEATGGERFERFVERQGVLALERAERELVGDRYKVPRLVSEDIPASGRFRATVA
jgi:glycerol-3-phosphate O-acyltransferase